ncbi:MAG TPA: hypothetical protein VFZ25_00710 [Chloroflexota bacterium]|nr:hypothetical protein [Chloroflexota bacterium]
MRTIQQALAVMIWFLIWVPTSLFVLAVMFKSTWATGRGRAFSTAALVAVPLVIFGGRSIFATGRKRL